MGKQRLKGKMGRIGPQGRECRLLGQFRAGIEQA